MDKGKFLLKGETGWVTRLYPFIAIAIILWLFSAVAENVCPPKYQIYIDVSIVIIALAAMYFGTKNWVTYRLYEYGIQLRHPFSGRNEFRSFGSIKRMETSRINLSTRYNRANYADVLKLQFEDGSALELSAMELDNFHAFRNLCMELHKEFHKT
jgi:hypothetical protein